MLLWWRLSLALGLLTHPYTRSVHFLRCSIGAALHVLNDSKGLQGSSRFAGVMTLCGSHELPWNPLKSFKRLHSKSLCREIARC